VPGTRLVKAFHANDRSAARVGSLPRHRRVTVRSAATVGGGQRGKDIAGVRPVAVRDLAGRRDKSGQWKQWYRAAIPMAEQLYDDYLAEREKEMDR
jgi:hypothetical protein